MVSDLFTALRGALTNVTRHAHARTADVTVTVTAGVLTLRVVDDGVGFQGARPDVDLADLTRRATWHGGNLSVEPGPAGGTAVTWTVCAPRRPELRAPDGRSPVLGHGRGPDRRSPPLALPKPTALKSSALTYPAPDTGVGRRPQARRSSTRPPGRSLSASALLPAGGRSPETGRVSCSGLVLGGGGVGQAYHAGLLAVLEHDVGFDGRTASMIAGTSTGSIGCHGCVIDAGST